eukprot:scaffold112890_cov21-Prasinocladus_malaysianus.AAC.1
MSSLLALTHSRHSPHQAKSTLVAALNVVHNGLVADRQLLIMRLANRCSVPNQQCQGSMRWFKPASKTAEHAHWLFGPSAWLSLQSKTQHGCWELWASVTRATRRFGNLATRVRSYAFPWRYALSGFDTLLKYGMAKNIKPQSNLAPKKAQFPKNLTSPPKSSTSDTAEEGPMPTSSGMADSVAGPEPVPHGGGDSHEEEIETETDDASTSTDLGTWQEVVCGRKSRLSTSLKGSDANRRGRNGDKPVVVSTSAAQHWPNNTTHLKDCSRTCTANAKRTLQSEGHASVSTSQSDTRRADTKQIVGPSSVSGHVASSAATRYWGAADSRRSDKVDADGQSRGCEELGKASSSRSQQESASTSSWESVASAFLEKEFPK